MNLPAQTYERLAIATHLVKSSVNSLTEIGPTVQGAQETAEDLAVALYELSQLCHDLNALRQTPAQR